jgi:hypothetical protein
MSIQRITNRLCQDSPLTCVDDYSSKKRPAPDVMPPYALFLYNPVSYGIT